MNSLNIFKKIKLSRVLSSIFVSYLGFTSFVSAEDLNSSILSFGSTVSDWFSSFLSTLTDFFNPIITIIGYIISIFRSLWYGLTSLLSGVWQVVVEVINGGVFTNVASAFNYIAGYIGGPATVFISTMLFLIIFRIGIAFVFKILRLNIDYHNTATKSKTLSQHSNLK